MANTTLIYDRKKVKRKRVQVHVTRPFRIGLIPFSGNLKNVVLSVEDINKCIQNGAYVKEILTTGELVPLGFDNYNVDNGPTDVDDSTPLMKDVPSPSITIKNSKGEVIGVENGEKKKKKPVVQVSIKEEDQDNEKKTNLEIDKNFQKKMNINFGLTRNLTLNNTVEKAIFPIVEEPNKDIIVNANEDNIKKEFDTNNSFNNKKKKNKW